MGCAHSDQLHELWIAKSILVRNFQDMDYGITGRPWKHGLDPVFVFLLHNKNRVSPVYVIDGHSMPGTRTGTGRANKHAGCFAIDQFSRRAAPLVSRTNKKHVQDILHYIRVIPGRGANPEGRKSLVQLEIKRLDLPGLG